MTIHEWTREFVTLDELVVVTTAMLEQNRTATHKVWSATWAKRGRLFDAHLRPSRWTLPTGMGAPKPCRCAPCINYRLEIEQLFNQPFIRP